MKILLADDEEAIRSLVAATLENPERYTVLLAEDGDQALEMAMRERPELVLLDVRMPHKDGFEVCRELKADSRTAHIKVIMLTALTLDEDRDKACNSGADEYFTKPFSPLALLSKVEDILALV